MTEAAVLNDTVGVVEHCPVSDVSELACESEQAMAIWKAVEKKFSLLIPMFDQSSAILSSAGSSVIDSEDAVYWVSFHCCAEAL